MRQVPSTIPRGRCVAAAGVAPSARGGRDCQGDRTMTVVELFEQQALLSPESIAVAFEGEEMTYGELNARANKLARHLTCL